MSTDVEAPTEARQEGSLRQVSIEIKRMMWIDDFKFPAGAKFCFGSHACQDNEVGDLVLIQVEALEEPKLTLNAQIRFGLPTDWQSRLTKPSEIPKMMEDLDIGGKAEPDY